MQCADNVDLTTKWRVPHTATGVPVGRGPKSAVEKTVNGAETMT